MRYYKKQLHVILVVILAVRNVLIINARNVKNKMDGFLIFKWMT